MATNPSQELTSISDDDNVAGNDHYIDVQHLQVPTNVPNFPMKSLSNESARFTNSGMSASITDSFTILMILLR